MKKRALPILLALAVALALGALVWGFRDPATPEVETGSRSTRPPPAPPPARERPSLSGYLRRYGDRGAIPSGVITASCGARTSSVMTDSRGAFAFPSLAAGECVITASCPGHVPAGPAREASTTAQIVAGRPFEGLEILLYPAARISGAVRRAGAPVPGAHLSLIYQEAPGAQGAYALDLEVRSDAEGRFDLDSVAPGRLQVMADSDDHGVAESAERFVKAGEQIEGLDIDLVAVGTVQGRVLSGNGSPIAGAEVRAAVGDSPRGRAAVTDDAGRYRLEDVPTGSALVVASAFGFREEERPLTGVSADTDSTADFRLVARAGFGGVVIDGEGQAAEGAAVGIRSAAGIGPASSGNADFARVEHTNEQGRFWFELGELPFPETVAVARHPSHGLSAPTRVSGHERDLVLRLTGGGRVSGAFVDGRGKPIPSFRVVLIPIGTRFPAGDASAEVNDPRGTFLSGAAEPGRYRAILAPRDGRPPLETPPFQVIAGRTTPLGTLRLAPNGAILGRAVDDRGVAIPGAEITVEELAAMGMQQTVLAGPDGRFRVPGIPDGGSIHVRQRGYRSRLVSGLRAPDGGEKNIGDVVLTRSTNPHAMQYVGVGMRLESGPDGGILVSQSFPGSPAERAGIAAGSTIRRVNGYDARELSMAKTIAMIRGEVGSEVVVEFSPPDGGPAYSVRLERAEVVSD